MKRKNFLTYLTRDVVAGLRALGVDELNEEDVIVSPHLTRVFTQRHTFTVARLKKAIQYGLVEVTFGSHGFVVDFSTRAYKRELKKRKARCSN